MCGERYLRRRARHAHAPATAPSSAALRTYVDALLERILIDGHVCDTLGTGFNDARDLGECWSIQAWMMPVPLSTARRAAGLLDHGALRSWITQYGRRAAAHHTVLGDDGLPDFSRRDASSPDDALNGWRTVYGCGFDAEGVDETTCRRLLDIENEGYFYADGLVAFLNVFGLILAGDPTGAGGAGDSRRRERRPGRSATACRASAPP